jgi:hypothetical protein
MSALWFLPQSGKAGRVAFHRGIRHLATHVDEAGRLRAGPDDLAYPAYTAAMASRVVVLGGRTPESLAHRKAWLTHIREHQLGTALGWSEEDSEFGGWGYSIARPRRPILGEPRPPLLDPNLSATLFALSALRSAKLPAEHPAWREALVFVERCQNRADEGAEPRFDDGGFVFAPANELQNKAGIAGTDRSGRTRYRSYGSMTADGLRALLLCGLPPTHPRVVAARGWLEARFRADRHPGDFGDDLAARGEGTFFYWVWSVTHAFARLEVRTLERDGRTIDWAAALADELVRRQLPDGTWRNRFTEAKEDDPLVATPWAASALAICRAAIAGGGLRRTADYPSLRER